MDDKVDVTSKVMTSEVFVQKPNHKQKTIALTAMTIFVMIVVTLSYAIIYYQKATATAIRVSVMPTTSPTTAIIENKPTETAISNYVDPDHTKEIDFLDTLIRALSNDNVNFYDSPLTMSDSLADFISTKKSGVALKEMVWEGMTHFSPQLRDLERDTKILSNNGWEQEHILSGSATIMGTYGYKKTTPSGTYILKVTSAFDPSRPDKNHLDSFEGAVMILLYFDKTYSMTSILTGQIPCKWIFEEDKIFTIPIAIKPSGLSTFLQRSVMCEVQDDSLLNQISEYLVKFGYKKIDKEMNQSLSQIYPNSYQDSTRSCYDAERCEMLDLDKTFLLDSSVVNISTSFEQSSQAAKGSMDNNNEFIVVRVVEDRIPSTPDN